MFKPVALPPTNWYNPTMTANSSQNSLSKTYDPNLVESDIYELWEKNGAFAPNSRSANPDQGQLKPYCIINPPTNANGSLHIGHAVGITLQDLLIRYHRLKGAETLWLPGFDHAGFETQVVYEKKLEKEGRSRFQIPREQLYQEMYDFTQTNTALIRNQFKKLGASLDWSREIFTLDPKVVSTICQTFKQLADDGLVYRHARPVNWCTKHQTALSDLEVKYEERVDKLYYLKYGPLTLATVRPETKFGDTALAVNPHDQRYQQWVGQEIEIEGLLGPIKLKVIADDYVKPEFGTGVVKITPAHDPNDFEVALRHQLPIVEVIDQFGRLNEKTGPYAGLKIKEAREKIVADLQAKGLIEKIDENYHHSVGVCYKCNGVIEPRVLPQWFVAMTKTGQSGKNLRDDALATLQTNNQSGTVRFVTKKFENLFRAWLKDLRDWNVSRQIAWGIQLPVWYCQQTDCEPVITDGSTPKVCPTCGGEELTRDPDVFDTWFSSGQWPMAALKANSATDFERFYPSSVMETGYDIIFFWVARMIMLGLYTTGQVPFRDVYLHGLVRDKDRQKMSKSKGNVIDPLAVTEQYGSDAVRLALIFGTSAGNDIVISEEKIRGMRNFANKLWNISRFVLMNLDEGQDYKVLELANLEGFASERSINQTIKELANDTTRLIDQYQFHLAAEKLYEFIWHNFADEYIEEIKTVLSGEMTGEKYAAQVHILSYLVISLKLLHPFMPFVTEAIYQTLPIKDKEPLLISANWPV